MSGQWEVVKPKGERRSKVPVAKTNNKLAAPAGKPGKLNILNGVKIEEVLPKSQVKNLYGAKLGNKENKPEEKTKVSEPKKLDKKTVKAPVETSKPKPPKSIEAGFLSIDSEEFARLYERSKASFPDSPIVWLKELTGYLNQKLALDIVDPTFANKTAGYPLKVVPSSIRIVIEKAVKEAGKSNAQLYFDIALTSMVTDLSKGMPAVGYRFFLQHIALSEPTLVTENLSKHIALRNSYQNRANVALSILWAVGQVGINDLHCGLKVFVDLMLPLLELKSYSRYVVKYLLDLLQRDSDASLTKDEFILIVDSAFSNKKNFPSDLQADFIKTLPKLKRLLLNNRKEKLNNWVELLLQKIATAAAPAFRAQLCDIVVELFHLDQSNLASWNKLYSKHLLASAILIRHISENGGTVKSNVKRALKDLFANFTTVNEQLSIKKRKDDGLTEAISAIREAQKKNEVPTKQKGSFFGYIWTLAFVVFWTFLLTEPFVFLNKSRDELLFFRLGRKIGDLGAWLDIQLDQNVPKPYYEQTKQIVSPYSALAGDLLKIFLNLFDQGRESYVKFVNEKYPIAVASFEQYAPGVIDNAKGMFNDTFTKSIYYYQVSVNYLQKEVFVGQLSPENIQRAVVGAFNTTSEKAIEYYHWVYQKVQTTIK